jgi:prepilin peptidase CpaA
MTAALIPVGVLALSGLLASWSDFRFRRIPNALVGVIGASGLTYGFVTGGQQLALSCFLHAVVALIVGFALFGAGLMGSGDGKYYAAVASWMPFQSGMVLLGWVSLAGMLLSLWWLLMVSRSDGFSERSAQFKKLPFGLAIAGGGVLAAWSAA